MHTRLFDCRTRHLASSCSASFLTFIGATWHASLAQEARPATVSALANDSEQLTVTCTDAGTPIVDLYLDDVTLCHWRFFPRDVPQFFPVAAFAPGIHTLTIHNEYGFSPTFSNCFAISLPSNGRFVATGSQSTAVCLGYGEDAQFEIELDPRAVQIVSLSRQSFVATDTISLVAHAAGAPAGQVVTWTLIGEDAASGVSPLPTNVVTLTDANGDATYSFRPADIASLVKDRRTRWNKGSRSPNPAMTFDIIAKRSVGGNQFESVLSKTGLGPLTQTEADCLRQEYFDYGVPIPAPDEVVFSLNPFAPGLNKGNYALQLSDRLIDKWSSIQTQYASTTLTFDVLFQGQTYPNVVVPMPSSAGLRVTSGYRNPQRNRAVGSELNDSRHMRGRALDLQPLSFSARVELPGGLRVRFPVTFHDLMPALRDAAATAGTAICERGSKQVVCGSPTEDHVHVGWEAESLRGLDSFIPPTAATFSGPQRVITNHEGGLVSYTLVNDAFEGGEAISSFHLALAAPIEIVNTPPGWICTTDKRTFVDWQCTDASPPYLHDVMPGSILGGFVIECADAVLEENSCWLGTWDHAIDNGGWGLGMNIPTPFKSPCLGDLNLDGSVDDSDFSIFIVAYNELLCPPQPADCVADLNADDLVDDGDFVYFVVAYDDLLCPSP